MPEVEYVICQEKGFAESVFACRRSPALARKLVKEKEAIVIGLVGFDNEHGGRKEGARVELHPVYGLAIHVFNTEEPQEGTKPAEDVWVILARNWGNEGACTTGFDVPPPSKCQHYLSLADNKMKFFLPAKMTSSRKAIADFNTDNVKVEPFVDGVLVTIQLTEPERKDIF